MVHALRFRQLSINLILGAIVAQLPATARGDGRCVDEVLDNKEIAVRLTGLPARGYPEPDGGTYSAKEFSGTQAKLVILKGDSNTQWGQTVFFDPTAKSPLKQLINPFDVDLKFSRRKEDNGTCVRIAGIELAYRQFNIYLANELKPSSCAFKTSLAHEHDHIDDFRTLAEKPEITRDILSHVGGKSDVEWTQDPDGWERARRASYKNSGEGIYKNSRLGREYDKSIRAAHNSERMLLLIRACKDWPKVEKDD